MSIYSSSDEKRNEDENDKSPSLSPSQYSSFLSPSPSLSRPLVLTPLKKPKKHSYFNLWKTPLKVVMDKNQHEPVPTELYTELVDAFYNLESLYQQNDTNLIDNIIVQIYEIIKLSINFTFKAGNVVKLVINKHFFDIFIYCYLAYFVPYIYTQPEKKEMIGQLVHVEIVQEIVKEIKDKSMINKQLKEKKKFVNTIQKLKDESSIKLRKALESEIQQLQTKLTIKEPTLFHIILIYIRLWSDGTTVHTISSLENKN